MNLGSLDSRLGIVVPKLGLNPKGIHTIGWNVSNHMFVKLDSKVEIAPQVTIPPFLEKKRENLKFVGFFKGTMVVKKHIANQLI
jgi:hypothetical protein